MNTASAPVYSTNPQTGQSTNQSGLTPGQVAGNQLLNTTQTVGETKSPAIAAATQNLLTNNQNVENSATTTFDQYLAQAQAAQNTIGKQVATDTSNLNALPSSTAAALNSINQNYANTTGNISNQYANINAGNAATVAGDISQLGTINQNYETAAQNVANQAVSNAGQKIAAYQGASGTPTSDSSGLQEQYENAYTAINLPLQQQLYGQQLSQLQNYITPLQQQLYGQNVAQAVNYDTTSAQNIAQMQTGSAEQIAALTQAVAGKGVNEALQYMTSLGIPLQVAQTVLSGSTSNLATLSGVNLGNTNYGIAGDYQSAIGGLPTFPNQQQPNTNRGGTPANPVTVGPQPFGTGQTQFNSQGNITSVPNPYSSISQPSASSAGYPFVDASTAAYNQNPDAGGYSPFSMLSGNQTNNPSTYLNYLPLGLNLSGPTFGTGSVTAGGQTQQLGGAQPTPQYFTINGQSYLSANGSLYPVSPASSNQTAAQIQAGNPYAAALQDTED